MELPAHLQNVSPDTPVMMYCTGGIRCDIYSAYLRKKVIVYKRMLMFHEHRACGFCDRSDREHWQLLQLQGAQWQERSVNLVDSAGVRKSVHAGEGHPELHEAEGDRSVGRQLVCV